MTSHQHPYGLPPPCPSPEDGSREQRVHFQPTSYNMSGPSSGPQSFLTSIKDAIIGHWNLFQAGILHCDVRPETILCFQDGAAYDKPFRATTVFPHEDCLRRLISIATCAGGIGGKVLKDLMSKEDSQRITLQELEDLEKRSMMYGALALSHLSKPWPTLNNDLRATFSGTPLFMSLHLTRHWQCHLKDIIDLAGNPNATPREFLRSRSCVVHTVCDDLEAFLWVLCFIVLQKVWRFRSAVLTPYEAASLFVTDLPEMEQAKLKLLEGIVAESPDYRTLLHFNKHFPIRQWAAAALTFGHFSKQFDALAVPSILLDLYDIYEKDTGGNTSYLRLFIKQHIAWRAQAICKRSEWPARDRELKYKVLCELLKETMPENRTSYAPRLMESSTEDYIDGMELELLILISSHVAQKLRDHQPTSIKAGMKALAEEQYFEAFYAAYLFPSCHHHPQPPSHPSCTWEECLNEVVELYSPLASDMSWIRICNEYYDSRTMVQEFFPEIFPDGIPPTFASSG